MDTFTNINFGLIIAVPLFILANLAACEGSAPAAALSSTAVSALPKTEQTFCYDSAGAVVACPSASQDGGSRTDLAKPSARFALDASGDCVTDTSTGLMWTRNANLPAGAGAAALGARTWQEALDYAATLSLCGFSDWRIANRKELRTLVNYSSINNASTLNSLVFNNVQAGNYWSSSSFVQIATYTWMVDMLSGNLDAGNKASKSYVWPVRGGQ